VDLTKERLREEIIGAMNDESVISCAFFVAIVNVKLSDKSNISLFLRDGSKEELDKNLSDTSRRAINDLPATMDKDMQQFKMYIKNQKRDVP